MEKQKIKAGDRVSFEYWDGETGKDIFGKGRVTDIDTKNATIHIQTTRTLHWLEYDGENAAIILLTPPLKAK